MLHMKSVKTRSLNPFSILLFTLIIVFSFVGTSKAADIYVPGDYSTIKAAISAASTGDTIHVSPGTYYESYVDIAGKDITIKKDCGDGEVIIDGGGGATVMRFFTTQGSRLEGISIRNGYANGGGGITLINASPTIIDCNIYNNTAYSSGGAAIKCAGTSSPTVENTRIHDNSSPGVGGAINLYRDSSIIIDNCEIYDNTSGYLGGAIGSEGSITIRNNTVIRDNTASVGGAIYIVNATSLTIDDSTIENNYAAYGGGVYVAGTAVTLTNCKIIANRTYPASQTYAYGEGGAMYAYYGTTVNMDKCTVTDNIAAKGGGFLLEGTSVTATNSIFSRNKALTDGNPINGSQCNGGAFFTNSSLILTNCTITDNKAFRYGGGIFQYGSTNPITIQNCILWGNTPEEIYSNTYAPITVTYSDVQDLTKWSDPSNISADPEFGINYRLTGSSPCIDKAPTGPDDDIDGDSRPVNGDYPACNDEGKEYDMGVDEFVPATPCP